jgi:hypothetical protein
MEWRCEWCGKPHEEDDPPCDNCGHGKFEKAVVRQTDLGDGESDPALVWVCTECGREHPKNSPPCSRCGSVSLEQRRQEIDRSELTAPGYVDLLTPRYLAAVGVAVVLGVVFVLGLTGVIDLPGFGNGGVPAVENVPGNATGSGAVSLAAVEDGFTTELADRLDAGNEGVQRNGDLDAVARYLNQQSVREEYSNTTATRTVDDSVRDVASEACGRSTPSVIGPVVLQQGTRADASAASLGEGLVEEFLGTVGTTSVIDERLGVDVHESPDGSLWLLLVTC